MAGAHNRCNPSRTHLPLPHRTCNKHLLRSKKQNFQIPKASERFSKHSLNSKKNHTFATQTLLA